MKKINVADYTLKKINEEGKISLLFREKLSLAKSLEHYGADTVELGEIKNTKEDKIVYKTIASSLNESSVCISVGKNISDMEFAWNCIKDAKNPFLQVELPLSAVTMEYTFHKKETAMLEYIKECVTTAKTLSARVEFCAKDASRADINFLLKALSVAEECGATEISVSDDAGEILPHEMYALCEEIKKNIALPLYVKTSDKIGLAVAVALEAVRAGADGVKCAGGFDEGEMKLLSFAEALKTRENYYGVCTALKMTELKSDIAELAHSFDKENKTTYNKDGENAIMLDANASSADVENAAEKLGYTLDGADITNVLEALKNVCNKKSSVGRKEFEAIIATYAQTAPSLYHLDSYNSCSGNKSASMSSVELIKNGERICGVATGDGPIDAAFKAVEQCIGHNYELDEFRIEAVTEGKEALGSALVRLRSNGMLFSGNGLSTDIVGASIRAYINALNKILYKEGQE